MMTWWLFNFATTADDSGAEYPQFPGRPFLRSYGRKGVGRLGHWLTTLAGRLPAQQVGAVGEQQAALPQAEGVGDQAPIIRRAIALDAAQVMGGGPVEGHPGAVGSDGGLGAVAVPPVGEACPIPPCRGDGSGGGTAVQPATAVGHGRLAAGATTARPRPAAGVALQVIRLGHGVRCPSGLLIPHPPRPHRSPPGRRRPR